MIKQMIVKIFVTILCATCVIPSEAGDSCIDLISSPTYGFVNGRNEPLRIIMRRIAQREREARFFLSEIKASTLIPSYPMKLTDTEKAQKLTSTIKDLKGNLKSFDYLYNHHTEMMTPRIEIVAESKKDHFTIAYKNSYQTYALKLNELILELESWNPNIVSSWRIQTASELLTELHDLMGTFHNRF